jgi:hypothetical protein
LEAKDVKAPASLLLDPNLSPSAKLIWLFLPQQPYRGPAQLRAKSGLTSPTIKRSLTQLRIAGWAESNASGWVPLHPRTGANTHIPWPLLTDRHTRSHTRLLYSILQLTPEFRHSTGAFTYASLSRMTNTSANTIKCSIKALIRTGWLDATQTNQLAPLSFTLRNPVAERARAEVDLAKFRLKLGKHGGEAIMREYLSLLIDSEQFIDDADPGFLVNPATLGKLELDRFYPPNVGFEFQGPQHDHPTEHYTEAEVEIQKTRDYIKLGMCATLGITVVYVRPHGLSLQTMREKVGTLLPLRNLAGHEPLISFLERKSRAYRPRAARWTPPYDCSSMS